MKNYMFDFKNGIKWLSIFILFLTTIPSYSQLRTDDEERGYIMSQMVNPTDPFETIQKRAKDYFAKFNSLEELEKDEENAELHEFYSRWDYFWQNRISYEGAPTGGNVHGAMAKAASIITLVPRCTNGGNWTSDGPISSPLCNLGLIASVAFDPNNSSTYYAGSNTSGLFKTTNGGTTWSNISDNFNFPAASIKAIAIEPANSNHILIGLGTAVFHDMYSGAGILQTLNGGASWSQVNLPNLTVNHGNINTIRFAGGGLIYAVSDIKIFKSTDNGVTWSDVTPLSGPLSTLASSFAGVCPAFPAVYNHLIDLEVDNANSNIIYISTDTYPHNCGSKVFCSTNGGTTWNQITPSVNAFDAISLDITPAQTGALFAYYKDNSTGNYVMQQTVNQGATWTTIYNSSYNSQFGFWGHVFEMSDQNNTDFYVGGLIQHKMWKVGLVYNETSVTAYWPVAGPFSNHGDIRDIALRNNGGTDEILIGCDGGVNYSTANGNNGTFANINGTGLNISQFYCTSTFQRNTDILANPQDNWVKMKTGSTWNVYLSGSESCWSEVDYTDDNTFYYSEYSYIYKIVGGVPFGTGNPGGLDGLGRRFYNDRTNHDYLWSGSPADGNLYRYNSPTNLWTNIHTPVQTQISPVTPVSAVAVAPTNSNVIYEAHQGVSWGNYTGQFFYRSTNGGTSFTDITASLGNATHWAPITHILFDPLNENRVWISLGGNWSAHRVMFSNDGGNTWNDINNGLPDVAINYLTYHNGSDDVIYAATDYGVFVWNKGTSTWDCFNNGLPPTLVTKVEINYCQNKLFASTYGRGSYSCPLPPVTDKKLTVAYVTGITGTNTLTIPSYYNETFGNRMYVDQGVYMNIKGTMNFANNAPFVVGKKSHVVLTGTMSTECPVLWKGIQVEGNITQNQNYSGGFAISQGILEVLNGGTVRRANDAVTTGTFDPSNNFDFSSTGGVISCSKANFIDNWRDIQFMSYPFTNRSAFVQTKFQTNNQLLGAITPLTHMTMWNVTGVKVYGCDFNYNAGGAYPIGSHGTGIGTIDAKYYVQSFCTSMTIPCITTKRGTFTNLDAGIVVNNSNPLKTVTVLENDFTGNYTDAARFSGVDYVTFANNTIDVGNSTSFNPSGLYMNNSKYYSVQNNTITTTFAGNGTGIYTNMSGAGAHLVYRNTINSLLTGVGPQNDNSGNSNYTDGLKIKCNTFNTSTSNLFDVAVMGTSPSVAYLQGVFSTSTPSLLVGNKYNATCGSQNKWYFDPSTVKGVLHSNHTDAFAKVSPQPSCSDPSFVISNNTSVVYQSNHCPNTFLSSTDPQTINNNISTARINLNNVNNTYNSSIDGGNTQNLLNGISGNMSAGNLKTALLNASPYLSDQVMVAYIHSTPPPGIERQVLVANSPLTANVMTEVNNAHLPSGTLSDILAAQSVKSVSDRQNLEGQLAEAKYNLQLAYADKVRFYLNDSIPGSEDSALVTIKLAGLADGECQIIAAKVADPASGITAAQIDASHGGEANLDGFCRFQKLILLLNQTAAKAYTLKTDPSLKLEVEAVANDLTNEASTQAQALLKLVFNTDYPVVRLTPIVSSSRFGQFTEENDGTTIELENNESLNLYPNPANDQVNILLKSNVKGEYKFELRNIMGQLLISKTIQANSLDQIDLKDLPSAVYSVTLKQNNKMIKETKLVIMK
jgi:photosystem II stability/assembly factor-like uncharacterized protein